MNQPTFPETLSRVMLESRRTKNPSPIRERDIPTDPESLHRKMQLITKLCCMSDDTKLAQDILKIIKEDY